MPGFSPEEYGYLSFTEILASCAELGKLEFGKKPEDRWFNFDTGSGVREPQKHRVISPIWDACVDVEASHRAWLDLTDCSHVETNESIITEEPERYIEVPRFDRVRQASILRGFSETQNDGNNHDILNVAEIWSSSSKPYSELLHSLQKLNVRDLWLAYLRHTVETELREWASSHGIPPEELFENEISNPSRPARARHVGSIFGMEEREFRAFLREAIDNMTLAELGQWVIPARLLLKRR